MPVRVLADGFWTDGGGDVNGNAVEKSDADETWTYDYDDQNRLRETLRSASEAGPSMLVSYA